MFSCYHPRMKSLLLIALLAISSFGQIQPQCNVAIDRLPALQGVRLRMAESEVVKLPVVEIPSPSPGKTRQFEAIDRVHIPGFKPGPAFTLMMYDQKVMSLVVYSPDIAANTNEFVRGLSNTLDLPLALWDKQSTLHKISCPEFQITVMPRGSLLTLVDRSASADLARANAAEKLKASKP